MLKIPIKKPPDETTCGPTCLHSLYKMKIDRVLNAILLGIITYDANLIIITPKH